MCSKNGIEKDTNIPKMALQGERKQEKVTDPVPWKAASAVPAEIEVGKQGFVNRNSRMVTDQRLRGRH